MAEGPLLIRRSVKDGVREERAKDLFGRQVPRRLSMWTFMRHIRNLHEQFHAIPDEFWTLDVNAEGFSAAVVACPCGQSPEVELGTTLTCECDRLFFFVGEAVLVANSPVLSAPAVEPIGDDEVPTPPEPPSA